MTGGTDYPPFLYTAEKAEVADRAKPYFINNNTKNSIVFKTRIRKYVMTLTPDRPSVLQTVDPL